MQIPRKNNVKNDNEQKVNAFCESPVNESRVSTSSDQTYEIDAKELKSKVSFRKLLEHDGTAVMMTLTPGLYRCDCPFHEDEFAKLFIWSSDSGGKCVVCGWRGDTYEYIKKKHEVGFYDAVQILNQCANNVLRDEEGAGHAN